MFMKLTLLNKNLYPERLFVGVIPLVVSPFSALTDGYMRVTVLAEPPRSFLLRHTYS